MDKLLKTYSNVLKGYLSKCFANQQNINPIELNKEKFKTKAVFISCVFYLKNNSKKRDFDIVKATDRWLKKSFANENLFSLIISKSTKLLTSLINEALCNLIGVETIDISTLYETMLGIESSNENDSIKIVSSKNYRNKLGSYFTPKELARSVTRRTIDTFFELNYGIEKLSRAKLLNKHIFKEFNSITFVDFSCGCGNFLIEVIHYFELITFNLKVSNDEKTILLNSVAKNIFAFDVDCLALEVAKLNLALQISQPKYYTVLSKNFIHGNFLLTNDFELDKRNKIDIFSSGFIYHKQLSVNKNKVKKYDVILGNPPWEKIRFEEKNFYALYAPSISKSYFKANRTASIAKVKEENNDLAVFSEEVQFEIEAAKKKLKQHAFFDLSNKGELNTYALFTDASIKMNYPAAEPTGYHSPKSKPSSE